VDVNEFRAALLLRVAEHDARARGAVARVIHDEPLGAQCALQFLRADPEEVARRVSDAPGASFLPERTPLEASCSGHQVWIGGPSGEPVRLRVCSFAKQ
jgi:hypothetical protein